ncbi:MAG: hypothetical protein IJJ23_01345 [Clostridia bacterium]|nr:hypothetical protein [Clostridia bacterium]
MSIRHLKIDQNGEAPVSPLIFGHNLEHTRACVSGGLSAQMLRNRKFAGRPQARLGLAAEWFPIGQRVFYRNDRDPYVRHLVPNGMWRRNELNAQTVQTTDGEEAGFGQNGLILRGGQAYELNVAVKAHSPVTLRAALTDRSGERVYAQRDFPLEAGEYRNYEALLTPDSDDDDACLRLTVRERCHFVVGAVSLLPQGHFHGMRRDVVDRLREIGPAILRWPGGNFAGEYRWQDMFLPVDERAPLQAFTEDETQPYTHGYDMHEIDTDGFLALCREVGAEPFITINLAWDTPEQCAAWVEYCNGSADTPYGVKRAARGHAEPYNVRYWSLGNEMGYGHMEGPMQPERYAQAGRLAAEAMLKASPDLQICSSGPYGDGETSRAWVSGAAEALKPLAPYISFHTYNNIDWDFSGEEGVRRGFDQVMHSAALNEDALRRLRASLPEGIHISYDEWNLWAAWYEPGSSTEGLYVAEMLQMMINRSTEWDVPVMCYFQPVGEGAIDTDPRGASLSAIGQVFAALKAHKGGALCRIEGASPREAAATRHGGALVVSLVNESYSEAAEYALHGLTLCQRHDLLTARDLLPGSRLESEDSRLSIRTDEEGTRVALPPRSLCALRFLP